MFLLVLMVLIGVSSISTANPCTLHLVEKWVKHIEFHLKTSSTGPRLVKLNRAYPCWLMKERRERQFRAYAMLSTAHPGVSALAANARETERDLHGCRECRQNKNTF
jgi:hypothetical protein